MKTDATNCTFVFRGLLIASALACGEAGAALHDRGGGLIYDDALNITWLQDANYAKTSGHDLDGLMRWNAAADWAANLTFVDTVRNVTYDDWRLPGVKPVNGSSYNYAWSNNGTTDRGFNNTSPVSEMSHLYYGDLGNKGFCSPNDAAPGDCSVPAGWGLTHTGPFKNLQSFVYWSGSDSLTSHAAFVLHTDSGFQFDYTKDDWNFGTNYYEFYAWAVRSGDVVAPAVPEPETYVLMLAGLAALGLLRRRSLKGAC